MESKFKTRENWKLKSKFKTRENWKLDSKFQNQEILKDLELENWNGNPKFTRKYEIRMFESCKLSNNTCYLSLFQSTSNFGF